MKNNIYLIKIKKVVGMLYIPKSTKLAVLHAKGGPSLGDEGESSLWSVAKKYNAALLVPDYIGYCRSDGNFNFKSCIDTIHECEGFLKGEYSATIVETGKKANLHISDILLLGSSWGGAIVPFLEKYKPSSIKSIALVKPVTDWVTQGRTKYKEEDVDNTVKVIDRGYNQIYRGFGTSEWPQIFRSKSREFNPLDNVNLLKNKNIYISHGKMDKVINWRKSQKYFDTLKENSPSNNVYIKYFESENHSSQMTAKGLEFALIKLISQL